MKPKFNFIAERQINKEKADNSFRVNLYPNGTIIFSKFDVEMFDLDGKKMRLYGDVEHRSIAWQLIEGDTTLEALDDSRHLKKSAGGNIIVSVRKLLRKIGVEEKVSFKDLPVKTYESAMHTDKLWYITIPPKTI
jgi:hypothetical protein